jgi:hypothetical protein
MRLSALDYKGAKYFAGLWINADPWQMSAKNGRMVA